MSGVPKSRRKKHDFETPHKLRALRKTITELAINDLGGDAADEFMFAFDASHSNSIYGNANTVQPPALTMRYIIKY